MTSTVQELEALDAAVHALIDATTALQERTGKALPDRYRLRQIALTAGVAVGDSAAPIRAVLRDHEVAVAHLRETAAELGHVLRGLRTLQDLAQEAHR